MYIGDKRVRVLFDTGSGELLVPSEQCDSEACKAHPRIPSPAKRDEVLGITKSTALVEGDTRSFLNVTDYMKFGTTNNASK